MTATAHNRFPLMSAGAVDFGALFNDLANKVEAGRTLYLEASETIVKGKGFVITSSGKAALCTDTINPLGLWQSVSTANGVNGLGQIDGVMTDAGWSWTPGVPLYVNSSGVLTATKPSQRARIVAWALSATSIFILSYSGRSARTIELQIVADGTDVEVTTVGYFYIPKSMDGMNLVRAQAFVDTAGTTNATTIQVRNLTRYAGNDALSTAISIASGATAGTEGTINASYDDVATDNKIKISVTGVSTTKPKGLYVVLEFE
jgi:hypothetical protein